MGTDDNQTYYDDHFAMYTNVELLHYRPETNIMLNVNFTLIIKNVFSNKIAAGRNNEQIQKTKKTVYKKFGPSL